MRKSASSSRQKRPEGWITGSYRLLVGRQKRGIGAAHRSLFRFRGRQHRRSPGVTRLQPPTGQIPPRGPAVAVVRWTPPPWARPLPPPLERRHAHSSCKAVLQAVVRVVCGSCKRQVNRKGGASRPLFLTARPAPAAPLPPAASAPALQSATGTRHNGPAWRSGTDGSAAATRTFRRCAGPA